MSGMRKLKYHEQKLLKKTDFLNWKKEKNIREIKVLRRYHIHDREDYVKYNKTYVTFSYKFILTSLQENRDSYYIIVVVLYM